MKTIDRKEASFEDEIAKLHGYTPKSTFLWTPKVYRENKPKEDWPVFKLEGRDGIDRAVEDDELVYKFAGDGNIKASAGAMRIHILRKHVKGWKNYKDKNGGEIPCDIDSDGRIAESSIARVNNSMQILLLDAINEESFLTKEETEGLEF